MDESVFLSSDHEYRKELVDEALSDWQAFNRVLRQLSLKELYAMYNAELMLLRRESFLIRLRQRIKVVIAEAADQYLLELQNSRKPKGVSKHG